MTRAVPYRNKWTAVYRDPRGYWRTVIDARGRAIMCDTEALALSVAAYRLRRFETWKQLNRPFAAAFFIQGDPPMKTTKQILIEARDLISDPRRWTQHDMAILENGRACDPNHPTACAWCADGAVYKIIGNDPTGPSDVGFAEHNAVCDQLSDASGRLFDTGCFVSINDGEDGVPPGTIDSVEEIAHANILAVFDKAIADCVEA
jgi:hypothetical protein